MARETQHLKVGAKFAHEHSHATVFIRDLPNWIRLALISEKYLINNW